MNRPHDQDQGWGSAYTCLLWNLRRGQPTVVTIYAEHHDRWIGRRCVVAQSSFEPPIEMFMKLDWQREEPQEPVAPERPAPAAPPAGAASFGAGALSAPRGFHPNPPAPSPVSSPAPFQPPRARAAGGARKGYGFHP
jgi:hypothetical protein